MSHSPAELPLPPIKPANHLILLLLAEEATYGVELLERLDRRSRPNGMGSGNNKDTLWLI